MNENTRKILADLKAAGIDTSGIENQITVNPILDKKADSIIGAGVLRQQEYTRYMNEAVRQKREVEETARNLATLHDASKTTQLPQQALEAIEKMEQALIGTGLFDEESVKAVSYQGKVPLQTIINDTNKAIDANATNASVQKKEEFQMPNQQFDESKFIDTDTFQTSLANLAYGGIATNLRINAALREVEELGIKPTRDQLNKLEANLRTGMESGKNLDSILDETFEISKARQAKQDADIENRIKSAREEARAEALKEAGVPTVKRFNYGRHPILDRKSNEVVPQNGNQEGDKTAAQKDLPVNKYGDVEVFRGRRGREERLQNASELHEKVMEHYANDPTFVE